MRRPTPGRAAGVRGGARRPGRPRLHADRDRRAAHAHRCTRVGAGRPGGRPARRRLALPRRHRGLPDGSSPTPSRRRGRAALPDDATRRAGTSSRATPCARSARRRALRARGSGTRCTRTATRARRCSFAIAEEEGLLGPHLRLFAAVGRVHPEVLGRTLPLNGAGVCGAALCDLGFAAGRSCAGSPCWPAPPGSSATSPRRCAARSARPIYGDVDGAADEPPRRAAAGAAQIAEEQVQVPVGEVRVAANRAGVASRPNAVSTRLPASNSMKAGRLVDLAGS